MILSISSASPPAFSPKQGFIFLLFFVALMGLGLAVPRALSFLPGLAGVFGFAFVVIKHRAIPAIDMSLLKFFVALGALALISCLWAPDEEYSACKAIKSLFVLLSCFILLMLPAALPRHVPYKDWIVGALCTLCAVAGGLYSFEYLSGFMLAQFILNMDPANLPSGITNAFLLNRSMVFLVLLCMPALLALYQSGLRRTTKLAIVSCMAIGILPALYLTQSQTAQIAACLAPLMLLYPAHKKMARRFFMVAFAMTMISAPFVIIPIHENFEKSPAANVNTGFLYQASIPHRLEVWNFISQKILEKPVFGHGMEATRYLKSDERMPRMDSFSVLHPHNVILQIWVEFGIIGVMLIIGFAVHILKRLDNQPLLAQHYYIALFTVVLAVMSIGYGLWQAWQIGMMFAVAALSIMVMRLYQPLSGKENGAIQE